MIPHAVEKWLRRAFEDQRDPLYHRVNDILAIVILISIGLIIFESVEGVGSTHQRLFGISEWVIVGIFSVEYTIYIYLARKKWHYIGSAFGVIDLLAILPTYLGLFLIGLAGIDGLRVLRVLRVVRLLRLFRLLKLIRYTRNAPIKKEVLKRIPWYNLEIYFAALFSVIVISGTFIYFAERNVPDTLFVDIPAGLWWATVTLTTVGYGDMVPATILGRTVAGITMISGLALFALLISVMGKILQQLLFGGLVDEEKK